MDLSLLKIGIDSWLKTLEEKRKNAVPCLAYTVKVGADYNKKYIRVWISDASSRSVFAFVDYNGNIYKPSSWQAPAKGIRGNIANPPMEYSALYR